MEKTLNMTSSKFNSGNDFMVNRLLYEGFEKQNLFFVLDILRGN